MITISDLKKMAIERPNDFDFKPSGILKLINRIEELESQVKAQKAAASAGFKLTARLCAIGVVAEKDNHDLIRRESVMEFVTKWRQEVDAAQAANAQPQRQPALDYTEEQLKAMMQSVSDARLFPMQNPPIPIPWAHAQIIYAGYAAMYGRQQSLERMAERGGFGWGEVGIIYRDPKGRSAIEKAIKESHRDH